MGFGTARKIRREIDLRIASATPQAPQPEYGGITLPTREGLASAGMSFMAAGEQGISQIGGMIAGQGRLAQTMTPESPRSLLDKVADPFDMRRRLLKNENFKKLNEETGKKTEAFGQRVKEIYGKTAENFRNDPKYKQELQSFRDENGNFKAKNLLNLDKVVNVMASGTASMVPVLASGLAGPEAVIATAIAIEKADAYDQYASAKAKEKGISIEELSPEDLKSVDENSTAYGVVSGMLEAITPLRFMKGAKGQRVYKNLMKNALLRIPTETLKSMVIEGGTEGAQRFAQNVIGRLSQLDKNTPLTEGVLDEAVAGALIGGPLGLIGGASGGVGPTQPNVKEEPVKEPVKESIKTEEKKPQVTADPKIQFQQVVKSLNDTESNALSGAVSQPMTPEAVARLTPEEKIGVGIALQYAKELPNANLPVIQKNVEMIQGNTLKLPEIKKAEPVVEKTPVEKPVPASEKPVTKAEVAKVVEEVKKAVEEVKPQKEVEKKQEIKKESPIADLVGKKLTIEKGSLKDIPVTSLQEGGKEKNILNISGFGEIDFDNATFKPEPESKTEQTKVNPQVKKAVIVKEKIKKLKYPKLNKKQLAVKLQEQLAKPGNVETVAEKLMAGKKVTKSAFAREGIHFPKRQILNLLRLSPEFKANPILTMKDGLIRFEGKTNRFGIKPEAMGLKKEAIKEGTRIKVIEEELKSKEGGEIAEISFQKMTEREAVEARPFEDKDTLYKEGITTFEDAHKQFRRFIKKEEMPVAMVDFIPTDELGGRAFGVTTDKMVAFVRNPKENTAPHEVVHAYIKLFIGQEKYSKLISYIKNNKLAKGATTETAEEWLADNFEYYVKNQDMKKPDSKLVSFFKWIKKQILKLAGKVDQVEAFYEVIYKGKRPGIIKKILSKPVDTGVKFQKVPGQEDVIKSAIQKLYGEKVFQRIWKSEARKLIDAKIWQEKRKFRITRGKIMNKFKRKELNRDNLRLVLRQLTEDFPVDVRRNILSQERIFNIKAGKHLADVLDSIERVKEKVLIRKEVALMKQKVVTLIRAKNLQKTNNLRKALGFPTIKNMKMEQLQEFIQILTEARINDSFLSKRQLETVNNTELAGIKTLREAKEKLSERTGKSIEELNSIEVSALDRFRYDTALAELNPFYEALVQDTYQETLQAEARVLETEKELNEVLNAARKSRERSLSDKLFPTDNKIFEYLESENKEELVSKMTAKEIEASEFIMDEYAKMRDYLISKNMLEKYINNYITHIRRGFFETYKEDGLAVAFKEIFQQQQEDEAMFKILSDTGEILPLEKFFRFSMRRSGNLTPTKNIGKAFMVYKKAFETKRALDAIIPKFDIWVSALTPGKKTKTGLVMDRSLKAFFNAWMNNKKGRKTDFGGIIPVGGKMDILLRTFKAVTTMLDLGFSLPIGLASTVGEQTVNFVALGAKNITKGTARIATPKGQAIINKYRNFIGKGIVEEFQETGDDIIDKATKSMFSLFKIGNLLATKQFLLGSLTQEEFNSGVINPERLAFLKKEMGRWRVVPGASSITGSTSLGKVMTQYKTWAVPVARTTLNNIRYIKKNGLNSRGNQELLRIALLTSAILFMAVGRDTDDDKEGVLGKLKAKVTREALTLLGALDPTLFTGEPRVLAFLNNLGTALKELVTIQQYEQSRKGSYEKGDLKGIKHLKKTLTPKGLSQFGSSK